MMMMPKKGMVCFIVFFDKKIYGLVKNQVSILFIEKVVIILLILWRPFNFSFKRII